MGEIKERGEVFGGAVAVTRVRQPRGRIPQLVEEGVHHRIDGGESLCGRVLEEPRDEVYGIGFCFPEHLRLSV